LAYVTHPKPMPHARREDAIIISVLRNGSVVISSGEHHERVNFSGLADKIRWRVSQGSEPKVYIRADARAKYAWVKDVIDAVHTAGLSDVAFLVTQRDALP
jgi:biopolymer transport protein ExbD